jgi:hypothetical protein
MNLLSSTAELRENLGIDTQVTQVRFKLLLPPSPHEHVKNSAG